MDNLERENHALTAPESGVLTGVGTFAAAEAAQRTAGYYQDLHTKLNDLPAINPWADRGTGVRQAWRWEKLEAELGGPGTRPWTSAERHELLQTGKVDGIEMHHINNVRDHPELSGHPDNLVPVTPKEHLARHEGNFQNETSGRLLDRQDRVEQANFHRALKGEALTAIGVGAGAFLIGSFTSWAMDRNAGWRTHVKRGAISGGISMLGYGVVRGVGLVAEHIFQASASTVSHLMVGAGLGFGMLVSGVLAYKRGLRGWALAGEVGWTGVSGLVTLGAATLAKGLFLSFAAKGALFGSAAGPLGMLVGAAAAIVVGLVLEGIRRWWVNNDMTRKVGEWVGEGARFLVEAGRTAVKKVKAVAQTLWEGAKNVAGALVKGLKGVASMAWQATEKVVEGVQGVASAAWETTKEVARGAKEIASNAWEATKSVAKGAKDVAANALEAVKTTASKAIEGAKKLASAAIDTVKGVFSWFKRKPRLA